MKELIVRTLSGVLYISIVIFTLFASHEWFIGLFFILALITLNEFLRIVKVKSLIPYLLLAGTLFFFSYKEIDMVAIYILLIATIFVDLFLFKEVLVLYKFSLFEKRRYLYIFFYIINGFVFLTLIPPKFIIGVFILIWSNDTFAYLIGKRFGKRKLIERISPKKTLEGFFGGIIGTIIAGFFIFIYTSLLSLVIWLLLALIISIIGTIGDLIQSKFKRQVGLKDSGRLMPGHGGLYDRLDSIIYASPFVYGFLELINYVS
ncbi:MAG: phosphatidate cytidylyltransferase [Bacteroidetes bacterium]|nr:phosphatidate cytidylyltransferase [Bacteroidota bacterium]